MVRAFSLLVAAMVLELSACAVKAQGMFWSDAELEVWRERSLRGPYLRRGDAFDPRSPGEWLRIEESARLFRMKPAKDRVAVLAYHDTEAPMLEHMEMSDAALFALVRGDSELKGLIREELLWHALNPGTQVDEAFLDLDRFPLQKRPILETDRGNWWKAAWLARLLVIADLIRDEVAPEDMDTLASWFESWARVFEATVHEELVYRGFSNRHNRNYCSGRRDLAREPHFKGDYAYRMTESRLINPISTYAKHYNNRRAVVMMFVGFAGVFLQDPFLIDRAKLYFEEWLQFSVFPDGSTAEYERNGDYGGVPQQGYVYNTINLAAAVSVADVLARGGDTSLYDYRTCFGVHGTECAGEESEKSIYMAVNTQLDLMEHKRDWFWADAPVEERNRIDDTRDVGRTHWQWVFETEFATIGNRYWKSKRVRRGYTRAPTSGAESYRKVLAPAGPYGPPWRGHHATYPSVLLMFAQMEGVAPFYPSLPVGLHNIE